MGHTGWRRGEGKAGDGRGCKDMWRSDRTAAEGKVNEGGRVVPGSSTSRYGSRFRVTAALAALPAPPPARTHAQALEAVNFDPYDSGLLQQHGGGEGAAPLSYVLAVKWHQLRGTY